jgi:hypothetical protein
MSPSSEVWSKLRRSTYHCRNLEVSAEKPTIKRATLGVTDTPAFGPIELLRSSRRRCFKR